jgi:hypothetical protein
VSTAAQYSRWHSDRPPSASSSAHPLLAKQERLRVGTIVAHARHRTLSHPNVVCTCAPRAAVCVACRPCWRPSLIDRSISARLRLSSDPIQADPLLRQHQDPRALRDGRRRTTARGSASREGRAQVYGRYPKPQSSHSVAVQPSRAEPSRAEPSRAEPSRAALAGWRRSSHRRGRACYLL